MKFAEQRTTTSEIAARRRQQLAEELGYPDPQSYVKARRAAGWGINRVAQELRASPRSLRRLEGAS